MKRGIRALVLAVAAALAFATVPVLAEQDFNYLALGDSYAFGFSPLLDPSSAANFHGYADILGRALDLNVTNAACPGETSGSMISGTPPDNGCHEFYPVPFPRHVLYSGSQLDFAVNFLRTHDHVDLVTVQIGGNDLLVLETQCLGDATCIINGLPTAEAQMAANLTAIYSKIRNQAHYRGTIVDVSYFAFNYNDPAMLAVARSLDGVEAAVAERFHVRVADVLGAFARASAPSGIPCLAGLQVQLPTGGCDIHPSAAGQAVYANAILEVVPRGEAVEARG